MRQAIHIFKKDFRHLRYEVLCVFALVAGLIYVGPHPGMPMLANPIERVITVLIPVLWAYVTVRAVLAEPLPGDRQFWITRPYDWRSLLMAKALFTLAVVNLPMLIADIAILAMDGFRFSDYAVGLLWHQVLLTLVFVVPFAATAALTSSIVQLITTVLIAGSAIFAVSQIRTDWHAPSRAGIDWIRVAFFVTVSSVIAAIVLLWQYRERRTIASRTLAIIAALVLIAAGPLFPWGAAFAVQQKVSRQQIDPASISITNASPSSGTVHLYPIDVAVFVPIEVSGVPPEARLKDDEVRIRFGDIRVYGSLRTPSSILFSLDRRSYERWKSRPTTIQASLQLTLVGKPDSSTIFLNGEPARVPRLGICRGFSLQPRLECISALRDPFVSIASINWRWKSRELTGEKGEISYSPSPVEVGLVNPAILISTGGPEQMDRWKVNITTEEPLVHFRREVEFRDIRLADFTHQGE